MTKENGWKGDLTRLIFALYVFKSKKVDWVFVKCRIT